MTPITAGRSASHIYARGLRRWRAAIRLPLLIMIAWGLALSIPVDRYFPHGEFFAGMVIGGVWSIAQWLWTEPPDYVARWKRGADGERRTARALRDLEGEGWHAFHDRDARYGNLDHVIVGTAGVFLLDSKNLAGTIAVDDDGLMVRWDGDRTAHTYRRLEPALRGAAAQLKDAIEQTAGVTLWVQALVVVWGDFRQGSWAGDRVTYLSGGELVEWLRRQPPKLSPREVSLISLALEARLVAPPAPDAT